jgi:hypothetical protein
MLLYNLDNRNQERIPPTDRNNPTDEKIETKDLRQAF